MQKTSTRKLSTIPIHKQGALMDLLLPCTFMKVLKKTNFFCSLLGGVSVASIHCHKHCNRVMREAKHNLEVQPFGLMLLLRRLVLRAFCHPIKIYTKTGRRYFLPTAMVPFTKETIWSLYHIRELIYTSEEILSHVPILNGWFKTIIWIQHQR